MDLTPLKPLYSHPGPFATVYLDASRTSEHGADEVALRWQGLRAGLADAGVPSTLLDRMAERATSNASVEGACTRVLVGTGDRVVVDRVLPGRPRREHATWQALPDVLDLVRAEDGAVPHAVVEIDREGADITVLTGTDVASETSVDGDTENLSKVRGGDWAHRTMQARAEQKWAHNAKLVAEELDRLVREHGVALVAVAGDEHAVSLLADEVSDGVRRRIRKLGTGGRAAGTSTERRDAEIERLLDERRDERLAEVTDRFRQERGRHGAAVEGLGAVVDALRRAQAETVLVAGSGDLDERELHVGAEPTMLAVRADDAAGIAPGEVRAAPAAAALLAAAASTDASVVVLPHEDENGDEDVDRDALQVRDGVACVLRYADASTPSA